VAVHDVLTLIFLLSAPEPESGLRPQISLVSRIAADRERNQMTLLEPAHAAEMPSGASCSCFSFEVYQLGGRTVRL
jgi:hypothetical protein